MRGTGGREWLAWGDSRIVDDGARRELSTKGALLETLDILIAEAVKFSDTSRTTMIGELIGLKNRARYCLADLGPDARDALRVSAEINFPKASEPKFEEQCYELVDQLRRVLESVRSKIENRVPLVPNRTKVGMAKKTRARNQSPFAYSDEDHRLYDLIGPSAGHF